MSREIEQLGMLPHVCHVRRDTRHTFGAFVDMEYVLQYAEDAVCDFRLETKTYHIEPGHVILMPPRLPHALKPDPERRSCYAVAHFTLPPTARIGYPLVIRLDGEDRRRMSALFDLLLEEWIHRRPGYELMLSGAVAQMLGLYRRHADRECDARPVVSKSWPNIQRVLRTISEAYAEPLTTDQLSKVAGLSTAYFCKLFKEYTGRAPHQYLNLVRIEKAKEMLLSGDFTCTEISEQVGFATVHSFSKSFKQLVGFPPSYWAAQMQ